MAKASMIILLLVTLCQTPCASGQSPYCASDVADPYDGKVNVTDLLALLGAWGVHGPYGSCPRCDIAPPYPYGDGMVNVTDLLKLLGDWGACPYPLEAARMFGEQPVGVPMAAMGLVLALVVTPRKKLPHPNHDSTSPQPRSSQ